MKNSRSVYSTDGGSLCSGCGKPSNSCICKTGNLNSESDGIIRLSRQTKGRKGKGVTLVTGFQGTEEELKTLGKHLRQICGTGGTVKNGVIEIQGDLRHKIQQELLGAGYSVKLAGG